MNLKYERKMSEFKNKLDLLQEDEFYGANRQSIKEPLLISENENKSPP